MRKFRKYVVGSHSAEFMVPRFWRSERFASTAKAVDLALRESGHYDQMSKQHRLGLAAYVFYQRRNRYAHYFATEFTEATYNQYLNVGVYPVDPRILNWVRFSTIVKYTNLLYGVQK